MKVAIIGGTGFVGSYLTQQLIESGHVPVLLVRENSRHKVEQAEKCILVNGDVSDAAAIRQLLEGADAVIYNIGILRAFPNRGITFKELQLDAPCRVMDAAMEAGVERFILMSANGVKAEGTDYQRTKYMAEQYLASSSLKWTVFRPSVIYGDPKGNQEFVTQLKQQIILSPLPAPLFFNGLLPFNAGAFKLAPVHITDVSAAFVRALSDETTIGKTLSLCGPDELSWREILQTIADTLGQSKLMLPAPALAISSVARLLDGFEFFPITRDQITMLMEGNTCNENGFASLDITPASFNRQTLSYLIN
jgi:NADH dehydrogenase